MIEENKHTEHIDLQVLNKALKGADKKAERVTTAMGLPVVKKFRNQIVEITADGKMDVLEKLEPARKLTSNTFRIR